MTHPDASRREVLLAAGGITKAYGGAHALNNVTLTIAAGEVHALIGENGAGKSTLLNILSGVTRPDAGTTEVAGELVVFHSPADAQSAGIATVFQELDLVPSLTVAENLLLGDEPHIGPFVLRRKLRSRAQLGLDEVGASIGLDRLVGELSLAQQQRVAIARACLRSPKVMILDEPTTPLGPDDVGHLFDLIRRFRSEGMGIAFVSHRFSEVFAIADRVTVLRDGEVVEVTDIGDTTPEHLVRSMTGRVVQSSTRPVSAGGRVEALQLTDVGVDVGHGTELTVHKGEVVGIAGLAGAGRSSLLRHIVGEPWRGGTVSVGGTLHTRMNMVRALRSGIAYIPEDRKRDGLVLDGSLLFNATLSATAHRRSSLVTQHRDAKHYDPLAKLLAIKGAPSDAVSTLSGGNQQKVLLARALAAQPQVLLLDEPTRGVDIGTKEEIWRLIDQLSTEGVAVLLVSSELPEILRLSDRVLVMREGEVVATLGGSCTEAEILTAALPTVTAIDANPPSGLRRAGVTG